jgi:serine/threonine protein phosphatase 1
MVWSAGVESQPIGAVVAVGATLPGRRQNGCQIFRHLPLFRTEAEFDIVWKLPSQRSDRPPPRGPGGIRIYAIGDVHGRADLLEPLLLQIEVDIVLHPVSRPIAVFLGDYIDRGPDSKKVIDLLLMPGRTPEMVFLKGNHEAFLLNFLNDPALLEIWRQYGGLETLISYGLKPPLNPSLNEQTRLAHDLANAIPASHRQFLRALKLSYVCGDFLFVHAGLRPLIPIQHQTEGDLLWIRDDFLLWDKEFEKIVVHGHTPVLEPDIRFNRINIDTGAFATGRLTCMTIEAAEIVPLIAMRNWLSKLPDIGMARSDLTGSEDFSRAESDDSAKHAGSRKAATGKPTPNPAVVAAFHAKKLKEDVKFYDEHALALLDPRRQTDAN